MPTCPPDGLNRGIGLDCLRVTGLSHDLVQALRRLRRDLRLCQACPRYPGGCPLLGEYNSLVSQALAEVWEEWGDASTPNPPGEE